MNKVSWFLTFAIVSHVTYIALSLPIKEDHVAVEIDSEPSIQGSDDGAKQKRSGCSSCGGGWQEKRDMTAVNHDSSIGDKQKRSGCSGCGGGWKEKRDMTSGNHDSSISDKQKRSGCGCGGGWRQKRAIASAWNIREIKSVKNLKLNKRWGGGGCGGCGCGGCGCGGCGCGCCCSRHSCCRTCCSRHSCCSGCCGCGGGHGGGWAKRSVKLGASLRMLVSSTEGPGNKLQKRWGGAGGWGGHGGWGGNGGCGGCGCGGCGCGGCGCGGCGCGCCGCCCCQKCCHTCCHYSQTCCCSSCGGGHGHGYGGWGKRDIQTGNMKEVTFLSASSKRAKRWGGGGCGCNEKKQK